MSIFRHLKNALRKFVTYCGYTVVKNDPEKQELNHFIRHFDWIKTLGIQTVLDIGANEGQFAAKLLFALPDVALHCFEPLPQAFSVLTKKFGNHPQVTLYNIALGTIDGTMDIHLNEYSPSSSFLEMDDKHKDSFTYAVKTGLTQVNIKRLDDLDIKFNQSMLVKIDVQGFEDQVINGGRCVIESASVIIVEVSYKSLYKNQPLFDDIYENLKARGFIYQGNLEQLTSPVTGELLQADAIFLNKKFI